MTYFIEENLGDTPITVRHLTMKDLAIIETLQQKVYDALPDKSVLQPLSTEEFEEILGDQGLMIGVFTAEKMIGFRALVEPPIDEDHLGYDCGLTEEQLPRVLYQEISNVDPDYRGYNLQKKMAKWTMDEVDLSRYDYICSTVKPLNIPSLKDKFSQKLIVKALKIKYVDKLRYVFFKDLSKPAPVFTEKTNHLMSDISGQQALLKEGFVGTDLILSNDEWFVIYER